MSKLNRLIYFIIIALMFNLCACGKSESNMIGYDNESHPESSVQMSGEEIDEVLYSEKEYPLPSGCSVHCIARINNTLMLSGYQNGIPVLGISEYTWSEKGYPIISKATILPFDSDSPYNNTIQAITAGGDNCFYVLSGEFPPEYFRQGELCFNKNYQGRIAISKYSSSGELLDIMEIPNWEWDSWFGIAVDSNQRIYIVGWDYLASFIWKSDEIDVIEKPEDTMCSLQLTNQGVVISMMESGEFVYYLLDESGCHLTKLPFENPGSLPTVSTGNMCMCQGLNGEYIISANSLFLECNVQTYNTFELYQWDYTKYPDGCDFTCRIGDRFFISTVGEDFLLVTGIIEQPSVDNNIVRVALYDMGISNVEGIISELNMRSKEYKYDCLIYGPNDEAKLISDLIMGDTIDLIIFNNNLNVSSDLFDNLYNYIDKDSEISREDFIPGILGALSDGEQLHELWEAVTINTIAVRASDVEGQENLRPDDYVRILNSNNHYEAIFQRHMDKSNLLKWVAEVGIVKYVNLENGTCNFDDPSFSELLSWCTNMGEEVKEGSNTPEIDISEVILSLERISDPIRIKYAQENLGEPIIYVGFPNGGKGVHYFSSSYNGSMAIPSNSNNKEGAWAYIKNRVSMDTQVDIDYALPVNKEALLRDADMKLDTHQINQLLNLLEDTTNASRCSNKAIKEIIIKNGQDYLAGIKSLEETVDLIQSKVSIYLSEQYG